MMMKKSPVAWVAYVLMVVGALNWGLVGFFEWNLVEYLFTDLVDWPVVARVVYGLVGVAGLYGLVVMFTGCKDCK